MSDKFDAIVAGAGPGGSAAALLLARGGLRVALLDRSGHPGGGRLFGGVLQTTVLGDLVPYFAASAPLERYVFRRRYVLLGAQDQIACDFSSGVYDRPPHNHCYTVQRSKFDPWFISQAEAAGATFLAGTTVEDLLVEDGRVVGVRADGAAGQMRADLVVVADGANSFLARKAGFRRDFQPHRLQWAVKEVIALDRGLIEQRFNLDSRQGALGVYFGGEAAAGTFGGGLLCTHRESVSLCVSCAANAFPDSKLAPHQVIERFKSHPAMAALLSGGETIEYVSHVIPRFGRGTMPKVYGEGVLFVGEAAGLADLSPFYQGGANLAMASGRAAAQAVIQLRREHKPLTGENLAGYARLLRADPVYRNAQGRNRAPRLGRQVPRFAEKYPYLFGELARELFSIDHRSRRRITKEVFRRFRKEAGLMRFARDLWRAFRARG